jgi:hypothetical protein
MIRTKYLCLYAVAAVCVCACTNGDGGRADRRMTTTGVAQEKVIADDAECAGDPPTQGRFSSATHLGEQNGTVDLGNGETATVSNSDGVSFDWSATIPIHFIIVRGTPTLASGYPYDPPAMSGLHLLAPSDPDNQNMLTRLTSIKFCFRAASPQDAGGGTPGEDAGGSSGGGKSW